MRGKGPRAPVPGSSMASRCAAMLLGDGGVRRTSASRSPMMPWKRASTACDSRTSCTKGKAAVKIHQAMEACNAMRSSLAASCRQGCI